MKKIVLTIMFLFSSLSAGVEHDCECVLNHAKSVGVKKGGIPEYWLVQDVFSCTGIDKYVVHLDTMDQDMIFIKAMISTRKKFDTYKTHNESPQSYGELIPKEKIDDLFRLVADIYP